MQMRFTALAKLFAAVVPALGEVAWRFDRHRWEVRP